MATPAKYVYRKFLLLVYCTFLLFTAEAGRIYVGTATADISPKLPVALMGQFHLRLARTAETPLMANVVVIESRESDSNSDYVIFVACDVVTIPPHVLAKLREVAAKAIPAIDPSKIILTATHTHTAPVMDTFLLKYPIPENGVTQIEEYNTMFIDRIVNAINTAWKRREPGSITHSLTYAVVGHNRRSVYANGAASLYGGLNTPNYRTPEGPEDHEVNTLYLWNSKGKLVGVNVTVGSPAQEVEGREAVNADFWHEARIAIKKRLGDQVTVVGWVSAAGDQAPRMMHNHAAEDRMIKLRNSSRLEELGRRIADAVYEGYEVVKGQKQSELPLVHKMDTLHLPMRKISEAEYAESKTQYARLEKEIEKDPSKRGELQAQMFWYRDASERFLKQYLNPPFVAEIHAIRIGDIVVCTNPFEMFTEFGLRIQGRSKALQTFVVQLAGAGNYLTTEKAVRGGGYSVIMQSSFVGPEGGDILVERMVGLINGMWP